MTFEHRADKIKNIIVRNHQNFLSIINEYKEVTNDDEEMMGLMDALTAKLDSTSTYAIV